MPFVATSASRRPLELDGTIAESHATLSAVRLALDHDFAVAERHMWRALGRLDEAVEVMNRALSQDPLSPVLRLVKGWNLLCSRRYEEAVHEFQRVLDIDPSNLGAQYYSPYPDSAQISQCILVPRTRCHFYA